MEYPDHLKTPVRERAPGSADLGDVLADELLWDAASWDPDAEPVPAMPGREPPEAAERLRSGRPEPVYRALCRLAGLGALPSVRWPRGWPTATWLGTNPPGASRPGDPCPPGGPAAGPATARAVGVQEALKTPGVRLICITGPAGVGKTRLAMDIVSESQAELVAAGVPGDRTVPLLAVRLRSVESGAGRRRLAMTAYDALLDLLLALGVAEHDIPASLGERRARYLAELEGRRAVVLIDDVVAENQFELLQPPQAGVVVLTSRPGVKWSSLTGVLNVPVAPLDVRGTGTLVRDVFRVYGAEADEATATAVHDWCQGTPLPVILVSRWLAATAQPASSLAAARRDWDRAHGQRDVDDVLAGCQTVAAMLSLLGDDQQMIVRMFGMLRLPEADLAAVCVATGLSGDRARAALGKLTDMGLLAGADSAAAWVMAPAIAEYAAAWVWAATAHPEATYRQLLDPLLGLYERRVEGLLDAHGVLAQVDPAEAAEWAAAEVLAAREVVATVLDAAAVTQLAGRARGLASGYLAATRMMDGRAAGAQEVNRFIGPVLDVALQAGDQELAASALERLGPDAAAHADEARGMPGPFEEPDADPEPVTQDSLTPAAAAAGDRATGQSQALLFGARA
jgi:hypothetical protein